MLNEKTFKGDDGDELFDEVKAARNHGVDVVMAHECDLRRGGCEFVRFFSTTPQALISGGLYDKLAVACQPEPYRQVSLALVAKNLGGEPMEKRGLFDHKKKMQKTLALAKKRRKEAMQRAARARAEAIHLGEIGAAKMHSALSTSSEIVHGHHHPSPFKRSGTIKNVADVSDRSISLAPSKVRKEFSADDFSEMDLQRSRT